MCPREVFLAVDEVVSYQIPISDSLQLDIHTMASLSEEEKHEVAVSYGTIIGTGVLSILVCGMRVSQRTSFHIISPAMY